MVAAMVGGNCNMEETLEAIWGRGDHPVKGIVAHAASDDFESHERCHSTEAGRQSTVAPPHQMKITGLSKRDLKNTFFFF